MAARAGVLPGGAGRGAPHAAKKAPLRQGAVAPWGAFSLCRSFCCIVPNWRNVHFWDGARPTAGKNSATLPACLAYSCRHGCHTGEGRERAQAEQWIFEGYSRTCAGSPATAQPAKGRNNGPEQRTGYRKGRSRPRAALVRGALQALRQRLYKDFFKRGRPSSFKAAEPVTSQGARSPAPSSSSPSRGAAPRC